MIDTFRNQQTIASPVVVEGFGYWSSRDVRVEFRPAPVDSQLVFVRGDLDPPVRIPACIENRIEMPRRTSLTSCGVRVEMVEHILAALAGLQIDNCEVWVDQTEMPGCDGSSQAFVEALDSAGIVIQDAVRPRLVIPEVTRLGNEKSWIETSPPRRPGMSIKFRLDYGRDNAIGRQTFQMELSPETFRRELAASRTFMFKQEAEFLLKQGLGTRVTPRDLLVFDSDGPIDNPLRFDNECVRHKILDLIGDLALAGCDLVGHFVAHRSGHRLNAEMVRTILIEGEVQSGLRCSA